MTVTQMNQIDIPVWVLNLERSKDRRQFMEGQLSRLGIAHEIITAVDGSAFTAQQLQLYSEKDAKKTYGRKLLNNEIGAYLSHISMWKRLVEEQHEEVLILEDDINIGSAFLEVMKNRDKFPKDYDLINFCIGFLIGANLIPIGKFVYDIHKIAILGSRANGACAYLIKRRGAEKLLRKVYPIRQTIDSLMGRVELTGLISYGVDPQVVVTGEFDSTIGDERQIIPRRLLIRKQSQFRSMLSYAKAFFLTGWR